MLQMELVLNLDLPLLIPSVCQYFKLVGKELGKGQSSRAIAD